MWLNLIFAIVAMAFIIILLIKRFVYFQPSYSFIPPKDNYQDINEGNLHAWYKKGKSGIVILFCNGNGGNLSYRQHKLQEISKMDHSVLIFDYSGFGHSKGVPNEQLCYSNGDTFINLLLVKGYNMNNIVPYGESLGASIGAYLARKYNLPKVILESPLPGMSDLIKYKFPYLRFFAIFFNDFDTVSYLKGYTGKSLVLHSPEDEIIPYNSINKIKENCSIFIQISGSHNNPNIPWDKIKEFLSI